MPVEMAHDGRQRRTNTSLLLVENLEGLYQLVGRFPGFQTLGHQWQNSVVCYRAFTVWIQDLQWNAQQQMAFSKMKLFP
jgi:hypothetical protein